MYFNDMFRAPEKMLQFMTVLIPFSSVPSFANFAISHGEYELASTVLAALAHYSEFFEDDEQDEVALELLFNSADEHFSCKPVLMGETEDLE